MTLILKATDLEFKTEVVSRIEAKASSGFVEAATGFLGTIKDSFTPSIRVNFKKYLSTDELVKEISKISSPQVIFWYMGPYGLRDGGAGFYKKCLGKLLSLKDPPNCLLYDLKAWAAFGDRKLALDAVNQNVKVINDFAIPKIKCLKSCDFFSGMATETDLKVISYLRDNVLKREWIFKASSEFPDKGIKVGDVFNSKIPLIANVGEKDTSKSYSAFQYLEGIYLVDQIVSAELGKEANEINIVFALPNDEWKYYDDGEGSFARDVSMVLKEKYGSKLVNKKINLFFYTFKFKVSDAQCKADTPAAKKALMQRPYNVGVPIQIISKSQLV